MYRSLDHFARYSEPLQKYLHQKVCEIIGRDGKLGYYDVTNYYFEIPYDDDTGALVKKGFRKKGTSKEHGPDPTIQMAYYSNKYANKQKKKERELVLAKAKDLITNPGKYTRATSIGAAGYIKNIKFVKETGEIPDGIDLSLNFEKIAEEEKYDGYYSIVTSEMKLSDREISDIYKGLWEIEESFKIIKSEFRARPVYLRNEGHINAHFLICFVSLLILRVLEYTLAKKYPVNQIRESLIRYSCSHLDQNYYLFDYRDEILASLEGVFAIDLGNKIMTTSEIKKICNTTNKV